MPQLNPTDTMIRHMLIIHQELHDMLNLIEQKKEARAGALIGGRVQIMSDMFRKLNEQKDYKQRFEKAIKEINEQQEKVLKENQKQMEEIHRTISPEKFHRPNYMG